MFMLEQRQPNFMKEQLFCGLCSSPSLAVQTSLLGQPSHSLSSLDETAHFLIVGRNTRRSWQKQACPHCRKRSVAPTAHHSASAGETACLHPGRSNAPRPAGQIGSQLETGPLDQGNGGAELTLGGRAYPWGTPETRHSRMQANYSEVHATRPHTRTKGTKLGDVSAQSCSAHLGL